MGIKYNTVGIRGKSVKKCCSREELLGGNIYNYALVVGPSTGATTKAFFNIDNMVLICVGGEWGVTVV